VKAMGKKEIAVDVKAMEKSIFGKKVT